MGTRATLEKISPFFIVDDLSAALGFYTETLDFVTEVLIPDEQPFFAIVRRDKVSIHLKEIGPDTHPNPNHSRHEWARWDAFILTWDPDALYAEFEARGLPFHEPLDDTEDGLRAFEIKDRDGYVLCFGRPL